MPVEPPRDPTVRDRPEIVDGPDDRSQLIVRRVPYQHGEPMIVRVMTVDHLDTVIADDGGQAPHVARERERPESGIQAEPRHHVEAGFARLRLEPVAGDQAEQHAMAAGAKPDGELDDGIGTARPPPVRHEMEDREAHRFVHVRSKTARHAT